jgi:hypothetical protein
MNTYPYFTLHISFQCLENNKRKQQKIKINPLPDGDEEHPKTTSKITPNQMK